MGEQMNGIDIGIYSYGRLKFLQYCIQSIADQTQIPYNLYVANNFHPQEPEIEDYLLNLLKNRTLNGVILIKGNIYGGAIDLLYKNCLHSDPFVVTDSDLVLPKVDYCCFSYMSNVLKQKPEIAYLTIRASLSNIGTTDEEVQKRKGHGTLAEMQKAYNDYAICTEFPKIGLSHFTGVFFQMLNRPFYERYLRKNKRFGLDTFVCKHACRQGRLYGSLLDDCLHLGLETCDYYPEYAKSKNTMSYGSYRRHFCTDHPGVEYIIYKKDGSMMNGTT